MRHFVLSALLVFASPVAADVPRPDTVDDTLVLLLEAIKATGFPNAVIDPQDRSVISDPDDENSYISYPDNLHLRLQAAASDAERQDILDQFVIPLAASIAEQEAFVAEQVLPVLRHNDYLSAVPGEADVQTKPFMGDLFIAYVMDYPTHTTTISSGMMTDAGLGPDGLHDLAMENLAEKAQTLSIEGSDIGIYFLTLDGYYEHAMLLEAGLWNAIVDQVGPIAVTVPTRDFVMIAPRDDAGLIKTMITIRDEALANSPYTISSMMYGWDGTDWTVIPE